MAALALLHRLMHACRADQRAVTIEDLRAVQ